MPHVVAGSRKERDYSRRQARMVKTFQIAMLQMQDYLTRQTEQQQSKLSAERGSAAHTGRCPQHCMGHRVQQKGQGRAQLNGEHPSVKLLPGEQFRDKKGCATLPQDTPSLEDTGQKKDSEKLNKH